MTFGEKLKTIRENKGMTQMALAEAAGIPVGTIRDYEQGRRDPLLSNAQTLAVTLDVTLDELAGIATETEKPRGRPRKGK